MKDATHSQHAAAVRPEFLLAHPVKGFLLERKKRGLQSRGLFSLLRLYHFYSGLQVPPSISKLGMVLVELDGRFLGLVIEEEKGSEIMCRK